jgi:hypothetical protein
VAPGVGAGCRNVDVGALPTFLGVKCCCRVLKAGLAVFVGSSLGGARSRTCDATGSSGLEAGCVAAPALVLSDLVLALVRLNPASLAEALGAVEADSVDILFDFA